MRLIRQLARLYGGRPGTLGMISLMRHVIGHLAITGGMAVSDSLVQQMLGHGIAAKLSQRLGEGVLNGLLTARLGLAAIDVTRPLPFTALPRPGACRSRQGFAEEARRRGVSFDPFRDPNLKIKPSRFDPPRKPGGQVCCAVIKPVNWPHRLQGRYVHHAGPHSRCSGGQPQDREDSGPNGSRSQQHHLRRHIQPPAGNLLHNITLANMFALIGAIFFVATLLMQTMVPLRVANMVGCAFFVIFGALSGAVTTFLLYLLLIPINAVPSPSNARSDQEGAHRNRGRHLDGMAQAVHDRAQISQGRQS